MKDPLQRALIRSRPSPGPGFVARAQAGAYRHLRVHRRRRLVTVGAGGLVCAGMVALLIVLAGRDRPKPTSQQPIAALFEPAPASAPGAGAGGSVAVGAGKITDGELPDPENLGRVLDLDAAQLAKVRTITSDARKQDVKLEAAMEVHEIDLTSELSRVNPGDQQLQRLTSEIGSLVGKRRLTRIRAWLKIRGLLSAKQVARLGLIDSVDSLVTETSPTHRNSTDGDLRDPFAKRRVAKNNSKQHDKAVCDEVTCLVNPDQACCKDRRGRLQVLSEPTAAMVAIDGRAVGKTPITLDLAPGSHQVELVYRQKRVSKSVVIQPGRRAQIKHRFDVADTVKDPFR